MDKRLYPRKSTILAGLLCACWAGTALAQAENVRATDATSNCPWQVRTTAIYLAFDAESDALDLDVDDQYDLAVEVSYFLTPTLAINVLATTTNVEVESGTTGGSLGSVDVLPPIFSLQWYLWNSGNTRVYAGAGVEYFVFSDESGLLDALDVEVDDSLGYVAEIGVDHYLTQHVFLNGTIKYSTVEADVEVGANPALDDELELDTIILGTGIGYNF
ncbi:OmpW/AlkL family protein [Spectribacter hydrogenooxidans]|uniref:OmpW family outer membrane protein n=1 Tax=Spectribacter hydrogenoxidans TaxID=3075608 RepID=A0ABU3C3Z4_9GAMM|nr:OmpW family outer membrane protein [Salinisphaera sp. W335]MDT0636283.1 OmpW family outer membrane protein [Salinisphaera sp. W335]